MRLPAENTCPCACHDHGGSHPCPVDGGCGHPHPPSNSAQGASERPGWACLTCHPPTDGRPWRRADEGYRTCAGCALRLRDQLIEIAERYTRLDPTIHPAGEMIGRSSPGYGHRAPASEHVIAMTDPRSSATARVWRAADGRIHTESEHPPLSVWNVLDTLAWDIAEQRGYPDGHTQPDVPGLCQWLDTQLDSITRDESVIELADQLTTLLGQLRSATGQRRHRIGACPNTLDTGTGSHECGAPLYAPAETSRDDTIRCGACRRAWPRTEWVRLGELLGCR